MSEIAEWLEQLADDLDWLARKLDELACDLDDPRALSEAVRLVDLAIKRIHGVREEVQS